MSTLTPNDVLAGYATRVVGLEKQILDLQKENDSLKLRNKELQGLLEEERVASIPKASIAKIILNDFNSGYVPIPEKIAKESGGLLTVSVASDDIMSFTGSIRVGVTFSSPKRGNDRLSFLLGIIPEIENGNTRARYYPNFNLEYQKPEPKKTNQKTAKPKTVKKAGGSQDSLSEGCTGNPS